MNWYLNVLRNNYANFEGRARRTEYWMFTLFNVIAIVVLEILLLAFRGNALGVIIALITLVYGLGVIVPSIAVSARRLHDTGRSGWWQLIQLVPFVGPIILLVFLVLDGHPGSNDYGVNPKEVA